MSKGLHDGLGCMHTDAVKFFRPSFTKTLGDSDAQRHRSVLWVQIFSSRFSLQREEWWRLPMTAHDRQEAKVLIQQAEDPYSVLSSAWDESKPYLAPFRSLLQSLNWILLWRQGIPCLFSQSRVIAQTRNQLQRARKREHSRKYLSVSSTIATFSWTNEALAPEGFIYFQPIFRGEKKNTKKTHHHKWTTKSCSCYLMKYRSLQWHLLTLKGKRTLGAVYIHSSHKNN